MIRVQMGADHVRYLVERGTRRSQPAEEVAADEFHAIRQLLPLRAESGIDQHYSIQSADEKAADRKPGGTLPIEYVRSSIWRYVLAEVARPRHEGAVGNCVQL